MISNQKHLQLKKKLQTRHQMYSSKLIMFLNIKYLRHMFRIIFTHKVYLTLDKIARIVFIILIAAIKDNHHSINLMAAKIIIR